MTIRDLLFAYDDHYFTDVNIIQTVYDGENLTNEIVASWKYDDYKHYDDFISYLDTALIPNELEPYFNYRVKEFSVINTLHYGRTQLIEIEI